MSECKYSICPLSYRQLQIPRDWGEVDENVWFFHFLCILWQLCDQNCCGEVNASNLVYGNNYFVDRNQVYLWSLLTKNGLSSESFNKIKPNLIMHFGIANKFSSPNSKSSLKLPPIKRYSSSKKSWDQGAKSHETSIGQRISRGSSLGAKQPLVFSPKKGLRKSPTKYKT